MANKLPNLPAKCSRCGSALIRKPDPTALAVYCPECWKAIAMQYSGMRNKTSEEQRARDAAMARLYSSGPNVYANQLLYPAAPSREDYEAVSTADVSAYVASLKAHLFDSPEYEI